VPARGTRPGDQRMVSAAATAWASSLVGPGGGTKSVRR
jgi:hypothetical protein